MKKNGFSLVELMIVIGIISILLVFSGYFYRDYATRAGVAEAMTLIGDFKSRVSDYMVEHKKSPQRSDNYNRVDYEALGYPWREFKQIASIKPGVNLGNYVYPLLGRLSIGWSADAEYIGLILGRKAFFAYDTSILQYEVFTLPFRAYLMESGQVIWTCGDAAKRDLTDMSQVIAASSKAKDRYLLETVPTKYLPAVCR